MNKAGLTLPELLVATAILVLAISGILYSYITCMELAELSKNSSIAVRAARTQLEEIKNTSFNQIKAIYDHGSFTRAGFTGVGVSYVDDSNPQLLFVTVTFCWRQKNGRIIGEDLDLNGQLDIGEDINGNGMLDSVVQLTSYIYDRSS